jgi:hypothetical protein
MIKIQSACGGSNVDNIEYWLFRKKTEIILKRHFGGGDYVVNDKPSHIDDFVIPGLTRNPFFSKQKTDGCRIRSGMTIRKFFARPSNLICLF